MRRFIVALAAASALVGTPALAAKEPSNYVKCDGRPDNITGGETAARAIALSLVVGLLAPSPESADASKRLSGEEGIRACTAALEGDGKDRKGESNEIRRAELVLARAVHRVEAKNYDAAVAEARSLPSFAPTKGTEAGFGRSLGLSALEVEASAHAHAGRLAEAEVAALRMGDASPWDLVNQARAATYLRLTPSWTPEKQRFYDRYVRMMPAMLIQRAQHRAWANDFAGAAADYQILGTIMEPKDPIGWLAADQAIALALSNDVAGARTQIAIGREAVTRMETGADAASKRDGIRDTSEALDFADIAVLAATGKTDEARTRFGARSAWANPAPPFVAALAARLRSGLASPTGALAITPESIRDKELAANLAGITDEKKRAARLFATRAYQKPDAGAAIGRRVWKTEKSKYLITPKKPPERPTRYEFLYVTDATGDLADEATLLHAALLAQSRGKAGFVIHPVRLSINAASFTFGNPGDPGVAAPVYLDAAEVVRALGPMFPKPTKG